MNTPAVTIRNAHERPEGMQDGVFSMSHSGLKLSQHILYAVRSEVIESMGNPYPKKNASPKIAKIVLSYIEQIKETVYFR